MFLTGKSKAEAEELAHQLQENPHTFLALQKNIGVHSSEFILHVIYKLLPIHIQIQIARHADQNQ